MCKLVPREIHISAQDIQVQPDTDLTLGYSYRVEGHEGHTEQIFLPLQHRNSCSPLFPHATAVSLCSSNKVLHWWKSGMDFPNQHSYSIQDKRINTNEWLGLGKRLEENRAAPLFLAAVQFSKINQNTSLHSSHNPHSSRGKKKAGVICSLTGSTSWNFLNLFQYIFDRVGQTSLPQERM